VGARREAGRVVAGGERRGPVGGAAHGVVDPPPRHDLALPDHAVIGVELAEPRHVTQRRADPAVGHGIAAGVDGDLGVELGAHRLPDLPRDQVAEAGARSPLDDQREHVGED